MLVVIRLANESILLGDNVKITVLEIEKNQVKMGVSAPSEMSVHHSEADVNLCKTSKSLSSVSEDEFYIENGSSGTG